MARTTELTQQEYKEARLAVANALLGNNSSKDYWDFPDAEDYRRAELLLESGLIDLSAIFADGIESVELVSELARRISVLEDGLEVRG